MLAGLGRAEYACRESRPAVTATIANAFARGRRHRRRWPDERSLDSSATKKIHKINGAGNIAGAIDSHYPAYFIWRVISHNLLVSRNLLVEELLILGRTMQRGSRGLTLLDRLRHRIEITGTDFALVFDGGKALLRGGEFGFLQFDEG